jgi:hypothetical protein
MARQWCKMRGSAVTKFVIFLTNSGVFSKIVAFVCSLWENESDPFLKNYAK